MVTGLTAVAGAPRVARLPMVLKVLFLLICVGAPLFPARIAHAERPLSAALQGDAKAEYEAGRLLFENGDFEGAYLKFEHAYELSGEHQLIWNMMVCRKQMRQYSRVKQLAQLYLERGGKKLSGASRKEAEAVLAAVQDLVTPLEITTDPPGAAIFVDGEPVGKSPLTVEVDVGMHEISAELPKYTTARLQYKAATSKPARIQLKVTPAKSRVVVHASPSSAALYLDGRLAATGELDARLSPGQHVVRVTAQGYESQELRFDLAANGTRRFDVRLQESSGGLPTWAWIAGGAALAVAGGVGAYFLLKPEDTSEPIIPGSLGSITLP